MKKKKFKATISVVKCFVPVLWKQGDNTAITVKVLFDLTKQR